MSQPIRIQRKRTKGFNLQAQSPDGRPVVSVCRPGKWGNAYAVVRNGSKYDVVSAFGMWWESCGTKEEAVNSAVRAFKEDVEQGVRDGKLDLSELRGKHLSCFCAIDARCHADVLLELANA